MKYIKDIIHLEGVKVLLRLDLNVPIKNAVIVDDFRIKKAEKILSFLKEKKAKVIIVSHIEGEGEKSLAPVAEYLNKKYLVKFVSNFRNAFGESQSLGEGEFILLENIRLNEGEKNNDDTFAKELASLADLYINEAFSVSHREHASVSAVTKFLPSYAGFVFEEEVLQLSKAFNPPHPFVFILGGAKFNTKLPLIEKFMKSADYVFIAGALANDFFKEKGIEVGRSVVSSEDFDLKRYFDNKKLLLPVDVTVDNKKIKNLDEITSDDMILDVGPETIKLLKEKIDESKFVLWNGPLGNYERGYKEPTLELAQIVAKSETESVVGGGDTLAAISELGLAQDFTFMSTGGGAMLDYLAHETLPGIEALEKSSR